MICKSHLYYPVFDLHRILDSAQKSYYDMIITHFTFDLFHPRIAIQYIFFVIFFLGILYKVASDIHKKRFDISALFLLWYFLGLIVQALVLNAFWHKGRYYINYIPIFFIYFSIGLVMLVRILPFIKKIKFKMAEIALLLLAVLFIWRNIIWVNEYGLNATNIYEQQVIMGKYIDENLPKDAIIGINDAGAIKYYSNRFVYDIFGLCTTRFTKTSRTGQATIYEQIASLPLDKRPNYFAIYRSWFSFLVASGIFDEIHKITLSNNTICGDTTKYLYHMDWNKYLDANKLYTNDILINSKGLKLKDKLNIALLEDEQKHNYKYYSNPGEQSHIPSEEIKKLNYQYFKDKVLVDAGRVIEYAEEFEVSNLEKNKDLYIFMRTYTRLPDRRIYINDKLALNIYYDPIKAFWNEVVYIIPSKFIDSSTVKIKIEIADDLQKQENPNSGLKDKIIPKPDDNNILKSINDPRVIEKHDISGFLNKSDTSDYNSSKTRINNYNSYYYFFYQ